MQTTLSPTYEVQDDVAGCPEARDRVCQGTFTASTVKEGEDGRYQVKISFTGEERLEWSIPRYPSGKAIVLQGGCVVDCGPPGRKWEISETT